MPIVLIVAEQQPDGHLRKATLNAARRRQAAGREGGRRAARWCVLAKDAAKVADELKEYGAKAVHAASSAGVRALPGRDRTRPAIAELAQALKRRLRGRGRPPRMGKDLLPRVAARLKAAMATDVMGFEGSGADITFTRPMWAGNVIAEVKLTTPVKVFTVRATEFAAAAEGRAPRRGQDVRAEGRGRRKTKFVDFKEVKSARPELTEAQRGGLRRPRHQGRLQGDRGAGRRARRRGGRLPRGVRRGLGAQRSAGRPDRQGGRARSSTSPRASAAPSSTWRA